MMLLQNKWAHLRKKIKERPFVENVLSLVSGTFFSQMIVVGSMPVLTRLYTPEEFGVYGVFIAVSAILGMMAAGRYEMSILLPEGKKEGANLVFLCLGVAVVILLVVFFFLMLAGKPILYSVHQSLLAPYLFLIPLQAFSAVSYQTMYYWFNREKKYKLMSISKVILFGNTFLLSIVFGLYIDTAKGLIFSLCIGQFLAMLFLAGKFIHDKVYQLFDFACLIQQAKRYRRFPKFLMVAHTFNTLSLQLPNLLFSYFFGAATAGYFFLAQRCINMPMHIVAQAIGDVFRENAAREYYKFGNCRSSYKKTFLTLAKISGVFTILLVLLVRPVIILFFGEQWEITGIYIQYLSLMFFINFISAPLGNMFIIAEKQSIDLLYNVMRVICISGFITGTYFLGGTVDHTVIACGVVYCLIYILDLSLTSKWAGMWKR